MIFLPKYNYELLKTDKENIFFVKDKNIVVKIFKIEDKRVMEKEIVDLLNLRCVNKLAPHIIDSFIENDICYLMLEIK